MGGGKSVEISGRASALLAAAVVPERVVALPHRLAEADLAGARHEVEAFLGVARDAVEERPEEARVREPHLLDGLVAEHLEHDELVQREARDARGERERMLL